MNVLVIDDPSTANRLKVSLKHLQHIRNHKIESVSPNAGETLEGLIARLTQGANADWDVVVVHANLRLGNDVRSSCRGLDILEHLLAEKTVSAVVLSFLEDAIQYSASKRLTNEQGEILLRHATVLNERLPTDANSLWTKIRLASMSRPDPERLSAFRAALHRRSAAVIRHRHRNLRAALRMLDGAMRLNLVTRDEYSQVIDILKAHHLSARNDLEQLERDIQRLPWPEPGVQHPPLTKKVLLIDDEAESCAWRAILNPLCRSLGADLDSAITLEQGENRLQGLEPPNAVLLDLHYLNVDNPPDPLEVLARAQDANPFVPIIIFTTEQEGRYVRDLGKDIFYYFFKEVDEAPGADTRAYAEKFLRILKAVIEMSLSAVLQGFVRLSIPSAGREVSKFDRAWNLLKWAASAIMRPEVALSLTTGAVIESRVAVAVPQLGAAWNHLNNLFSSAGFDLNGLQSKLPEIVRIHRNYASHYEEPPNPMPTLFDAVVYLLAATQFTADLQTIHEQDSLSITREYERLQLLGALERAIKEISQVVDSSIVLETELLETLQNLTTCSEQNLSQQFEAKCLELQAEGRSPFWQPGTNPSAFSRVLGVWFGDSPANLGTIDWRGGQHVAPYLLYVCRFLLLERVGQMAPQEWENLMAWESGGP